MPTPLPMLAYQYAYPLYMATIPPAIVPVTASRWTPPAGPLSAREREVLAHLAAGQSNKVIARALSLSPHTVKRHVANILDKLALRSRGQAAAWWLTQPRLQDLP